MGDSGKDDHNKLASLYRGDRLSCNVFVQTFSNKGCVTSSKLKMRDRREVVPELASNTGVTCHSKEHMMELKQLGYD